MKLYINPHQFVEIDTATSKPVTQEIASRSSAYDFQAMFDFLPNPDPVLRETGQDIAVYNNLMNDAHLGCEVDKLIDGVKALEWDVDRGKTKSRYARMIKDWMKIFDWPQFIEGVVGARLFGYQPLEVIWQIKDEMYLPLSCVPKPHQWFVYDDKNRLMFRSKDSNSGELLDKYPRKFLVPRYRSTYTNPYGAGVLSRCFWPVAFKKGGLKLWLQFIERYGGAFITIKVPASATPAEREELLAAGKRMIQDAVSVINDTDRLEITEAAGKQASADLFRALLDFNNEEISKAITSQTLTSQVNDKGTLATGKVHDLILGTAVGSVANLVILTINELARWIIEVNFGDVPAPEIILYEKNDVDKTLAERDKTLSEAGVKFTRGYYIRTYGFEEDDLLDAPSQIPIETKFADRHQDTVAPDQEAVDLLGDELTDANLQNQIEPILNPVMRMVAGCRNYGELADQLAKAYPEMVSDEIEKTLGMMIFLSEIAGRANAAD